MRTPLAKHPLIVRSGTSDALVFTQVFVHREYRCLEHVEDATLIIDCGANVGYSSAYLLTRFPEAKLIAIEPHPENFRILQKNLRPYGDRCTALMAGVWSESVGLVASDQRLGDRREWAVTVRPAVVGENPSITAVDLGSVLAETGSDRISVLKVDIEGSEAEVFARNTSGWLGNVDHLVIELHGDECRDVVTSAMAGLEFDVFEHEELTVFTRSQAGR